MRKAGRSDVKGWSIQWQMRNHSERRSVEIGQGHDFEETTCKEGDKSLSNTVGAILLGTYFSISAICAALQQLDRGASTLDRSSE
jgi:hypothetical protein